jgi:hypothetical protein
MLKVFPLPVGRIIPLLLTLLHELRDLMYLYTVKDDLLYDITNTKAYIPAAYLAIRAEWLQALYTH